MSAAAPDQDRARHPPRRLHEIPEIVGMLAQRIETLARQLYPLGVKEGHEWRIGSVRGEKGRSLAIHIGHGAKAGVWKDFSTSDMHGDALDLIDAALFGKADKKAALRWARDWLGLDGDDRAHVARQVAKVAERSARQDAAKEDEATRGQAQALWIAGRPILDTPVEIYLKGRGIDLRALPRLPGALKFHPECFCAETGSWEPAMVTWIGDARGQFAAVHRTWLQVHADGRVTKADLRDAKKTLGRWRGGMIRLWRGVSGKPLNDAPPGSTLMLSEGIEDGFTAVLARPQFYCGAAVSIGNMANIVLPAGIEQVVILRQNDEGKQAIAELDKAIAAFLAQGREVRAVEVPGAIGGAKCKDANDLARMVDKSQVGGSQ